MACYFFKRVTTKRFISYKNLKKNMEDIDYDVISNVEALRVKYGDRKIVYPCPLPLVLGTHEEAFKELNTDSIRPAEDLELTLFINGAFENVDKEPEWNKAKYFLLDSFRIPKRCLYKPTEDITGPGILVERDTQGFGRSSEIDYNNAITKGGWKMEDGIYVNEDLGMNFVPDSQYKGGALHTNEFVKDGLVKALLGGEESAEIFAKTAQDYGRELWSLPIELSYPGKKEVIMMPKLGYNEAGHFSVGANDSGSGFNVYALGVRKAA